ncbi:MAG TPA: hypothetical protein RMH85_26140 [Polyangiaceae bacterium LLY-WYZ-15_(1-7)]|nr:hypothetical protein [Polyangiaceae bacterium LLY-WYZ-15_(1-7)]HJL04083.1 hypothetical protein [Polyangiaceae bacterium LLY-WYZ-15_(1-7)]HJL11983.1 hypothetical protein [Polyangiaceae bacterium LLY-WYZ-15_(1-7)]HJL30848.1 hypothetical protein [Polyangiaceae bacterium LLY-WYZ-15_(1-7)]HJL34134.1 hypothetical protein [Polyangiaceae bacterium LLY-WYZ-15_(1-7)]
MRARNPRAPWGVGLFVGVFLACLAAACGEGVEGEEAAARAWARAQAAWQRGDLGAYAAWQELDPQTAPGREAHARLEAADAHYRRGLGALESGEDGAREALAEGAARAPMNPAYYLRLARATRDRGIALRAAEYYSKYLAAFPDGPDSDAARRELRQLDPQLAGVFDPPGEPTAAAALEAPRENEPWLIALGGLVLGVLSTITVTQVARWLRLRGISLERLVRTAPEFHPAVAYLVGSLRHELLKHRFGAAGDALRGDAPPPEQLAFLRDRLFGGTPLVEAWEGHLIAFERALGARVDLRRDRAFRRAGRAVRTIARLERPLRDERAEAIPKLARAHARLVEFDAYLAELVRDLVRTRVDEALLREVVDAVRAEHSAGQVELDAVEVEAPEEEVLVDVFRADLVLVLKNVVRNAVLAVGRGAAPRRLRVDVVLELEPTGDETVQLRVLDSSEEALDPAVLFDRRVDRGLGLVAAAVHRYGGTIDVAEVAREGFAKAVVISFFRAA